MRVEESANPPVTTKTPALPPLPTSVVGSRRGAWTVAAVAAITVAALVIGLWDLTGRSIWADEGATWMDISQHGGAFAHAIASEGGDMLGYYLLMHVIVGVAGVSVFILRFPSVLFGTISVPLAAALAYKVSKRQRAAIIAAALVATAPGLVYWEQDARAYATDAMLGVATTLAFLYAVRSDRKAGWAGYVVLSAVAWLFHPLATLMTVAQLPCIFAVAPWRELVRSRLIHKAVASGVGIAILASPMLILAMRKGTSQIAWVPPPSMAAAKEITAFLAGASPLPAGNHYYLVLLVAMIACWALGVLVVCSAVVRRGRSVTSFGLLLVLSVAAGPPFMALAASKVVTPVFLDRYLIASIPLGAVLAAIGVSRLRLSWWMLAPPLAVILALRMAGVIGGYGTQTDDYLGQFSYLVAHAQPGDCVTFYPKNQQTPYFFYADQTSESKLPDPVMPSAARHRSPTNMYTPQLHTLVGNPYQTLPAIAATTSTCQRIWVFAGHLGSKTGTPSQQVTNADWVSLLRHLRIYYREIERRPDNGLMLQLWSIRAGVSA